MSIIIFSAPVHSGKTTALMNWCRNKKDIGGILMPEINGSRQFLNIQTKEIFEAECKFPEQNNATLIRVGQYSFYEDAFLQANKILLSASPELTHIIVDEVGKLELQQKALYEGTFHLLNRSSPSQHIILVVRDTLVKAVVTAFNLTNYSLIYNVEELY